MPHPNSVGRVRGQGVSRRAVVDVQACRVCRLSTCLINLRPHARCGFDVILRLACGSDSCSMHAAASSRAAEKLSRSYRCLCGAPAASHRRDAFAVGVRRQGWTHGAQVSRWGWLSGARPLVQLGRPLDPANVCGLCVVMAVFEVNCIPTVTQFAACCVVFARRGCLQHPRGGG